jgi:putative transposase
MAHSYSSILFHLVWSTKNRDPWIDKETKKRLYSYIRRLSEDEGASLFAINGMPDHVHILVKLKPSIQLADFVRKLKGGSSKWARQTLPGLSDFFWQDGYGAFTVGYSTKDAVLKYIRNQKEHHREKSYDAEFTELLKMQEIQYDERFVLG